MSVQKSYRTSSIDVSSGRHNKNQVSQTQMVPILSPSIYTVAMNTSLSMLLASIEEDRKSMVVQGFLQYRAFFSPRYHKSETDLAPRPPMPPSLHRHSHKHQLHNCPRSTIRERNFVSWQSVGAAFQKRHQNVEMLNS